MQKHEAFIKISVYLFSIKTVGFLTITFSKFVFCRMADYSEGRCTLGYLDGPRGEYPRALMSLSQHLEFEGEPRYYWRTVRELPRPAYLVEVRIYWSQDPEAIAHRIETTVPRDHLEYAISDAATLALQELHQEYRFDLEGGDFERPAYDQLHRIPGLGLPGAGPHLLRWACQTYAAEGAQRGYLEEISLLRSSLRDEHDVLTRSRRTTYRYWQAATILRRERDSALRQLDHIDPEEQPRHGVDLVLARPPPPPPRPERRPVRHTARKRTLPPRALVGVPVHQPPVVLAPPEAPIPPQPPLPVPELPPPELPALAPEQPPELPVLVRELEEYLRAHRIEGPSQYYSRRPRA